MSIPTVGELVTFPDSPYWTEIPHFVVVEVENDTYPRVKIQCVKKGHRSYFGEKQEWYSPNDEPFYVFHDSLGVV